MDTLIRRRGVLLVTRDCLAFLKMQTVGDGPVIGISLLDIRMSRCKVSSQEAKASVVILQPNAYSTLVSGHSP